jgi:hypothetical protein
MANQSQLDIIKKGASSWNTWRRENQDVPIDLRDAHLGDIKLPKVDLRLASLNGIRLRWAYLREAQLAGANLNQADLRIIDFSRADLRGASLRQARLMGAYLREANLDGADLCKANLLGVNLDRVSLRGANLEGANLTNAVLVDVDLTQANLNNSRVYGTSVWNVKIVEAKQQNLIITPTAEPQITVDNLKVAQFIYLLLNNQEVRDVIDTITSKMVLILGRFTPQRKLILDAIRQELRKHDYLPVMFDFDVPKRRDTDETLNLLARMAKFVIADISEAKSIPQELKGIVEALPSVPVQPILHESGYEYGMFDHIKRYPWVLEPYRYNSADEIISSISERIIKPAEIKANEVIRS